MGNKILENSKLISFIIEFVIGTIVGIFLIIFFINIGVHYFATPIKKIKNIKSNKTIVLNKVNINNTHDKFIKLFYSTLVNNPANISNYLSSNFKNYLFTTYKSTDYTNDIQNILSLNSLPSQLHFYMDFSNYSTVYINANQSYLYFNIYFTRYNNSFVVTDITLSEG